MLPPVTKKYTDCSTDEFFQFGFYCDACATEWKSWSYPFSMRDAPANSNGERNARALMWKAEHDAVYERANNEAMLQFNKCTKCGQRICDDCFSEFEVSCQKCLFSYGK